MAGRAGLEPATFRLTVGCSTTELPTMVRAEGFGPSTSRFQTERATRLRHTLKLKKPLSGLLVKLRT